VGSGGTIVATSNGGATWTAQTSGTTDTLDAVAFSDASDGWAVGGDGTIIATTNGGATWSRRSSGTTDNLDSVAFATAKDGWAVGTAYDGLGHVIGNVILATTNGGATWRAQSSGTTNSLNAVVAGDASHGWVAGGNGTILATANAGSTWTAQSSGTSGDLNAVTFCDVSHGWAVGETAGTGSGETNYDYGTIVATTTGGWSGATPALTAKLTLKLSGLKHGALKRGKRLTAKGSVTPSSLAGSKVTLTVQRKVGSKWRKAKTMTATIATSGTYRCTYKPTKKGGYRLRATIAKTATHTAASTPWRTFRVK
jgi:photosystem II stability/assembly factor-like uncharacterized protein